MLDNEEDSVYVEIWEIPPDSLVLPVSVSLEHMLDSGFLVGMARVWGVLLLEELHGIDIR